MERGRVDVRLDPCARRENDEAAHTRLPIELGAKPVRGAADRGYCAGIGDSVIDAENEHYADRRRALATRDSIRVTVSSAL